MDYNNPWVYNEKPMSNDDFPEGTVGFVYEITNKINGRKYLGKKILHSAKKKLVNGKNKRYKVDSDWKKYYGSSEEVKADLLKYGKENFSRKILYLCKDKSSCSYLETKEIFVRDALLKLEFYNSWLSCRINKKNLNSLRNLHEYWNPIETGTI
jgi:hypothetical protein